jgi:hypothetical protein
VFIQVRNRTEIAVTDAAIFPGCRELHSIPFSERPVFGFIDRDTLQAAGIVGDNLAVDFLDRNFILLAVDVNDSRIALGFQAERLAAPEKTDGIANLIGTCDTAVLTRYILPID